MTETVQRGCQSSNRRGLERNQAVCDVGIEKDTMNLIESLFENVVDALVFYFWIYANRSGHFGWKFEGGHRGL